MSGVVFGRRVRGAVVAVVAIVLAGAVGSCSAESSTDAFVGGGGQVRFDAPADRVAAPNVAGETLEGERLELSQFEGQTIVVNVWGSWCSPCRKEAPALAGVSRRYSDQDVQFVGIAIREESTRARAFSERVGIPYPSISDPTSQTLLGFAEAKMPSGAIPTTWIIDNQGRMAVRVLDEVSASTLSGLIDDVKSGRSRLTASD